MKRSGMKKAKKINIVNTPNRVDHVVLPVSALGIARSRMKALGFSVAEDAQHPFGTENCCIYFADGTYLEPLGIAQRETCEATARKGNTFTARDQAYRFRHPQDGFSAIAFTADDAKSDHKKFVRNGISAGRTLSFKRKIADGKGATEELSFVTAFAGDLRSPDLFYLACERKNTPDIDLAKLQRHKNGVKSIREIVLSEANPSDFQYLLQEVIGQRNQNSNSFGIELRSANVNISVLSPIGMRAWFGAEVIQRERGLAGRAIVLGVRNLDKTRGYFDDKNIKYHETAGRIVVDPAPGQGAILAFEGEK